MKIVLASASPRRRELIGRIAGISADIIAAKGEERAEFVNPGMYVCSLARHKAEEVASPEILSRYDAFVAADTVVVADGKPLGKPASPRQAKEMLASLSDKKHWVFTGVCVKSKRKTVCFFEETAILLGSLDEKFIDEYVASGSPMDKAGAYGLQDEQFTRRIKAVEGDRDNVIGLPVASLKKILKEYFGWEE